MPRLILMTVTRSALYLFIWRDKGTLVYKLTPELSKEFIFLSGSKKWSAEVLVANEGVLLIFPPQVFELSLDDSLSFSITTCDI